MEADLYYRQLTDLANLKVTPLSLGPLSATLSLPGHSPTLSTSLHQCPAISLPHHRLLPSPNTGALLNCGSLRLSAGCQLARQARCADRAAKCKTCKAVAKEGDGLLLACCFCASNFHNTKECLGAGAMEGPQAVLVTKAANTFTWACPMCFSKGLKKQAVRILQPEGAHVAGAKQSRRKR